MNFDYKLSAWILAGFIFILAGLLADTWGARIPFLLLGVGLLLANVLRLQGKENK